MSFHPAQFKIVHKDQESPGNSFVGIRRNGAGTPKFVLPPGFDEFPASDPEAVSKYFFRLFRALRHFREFCVRHRKPFDESDFGGGGGIQITPKSSEPAMLYSKIRALEKVIERHDQLRIYNVLYRSRRTEEIEYSQIHQYLDQAIYQNDVPYVGEMRLSRPAIEVDTTTLVRLFCYIYAQIAPRIGKDLASEVKAEAARFKSRKLSADSSLFQSVDTHRRTVDRLKQVLDEIDREVAHKGADYWYFFEAVETFLYGRLDEKGDGISWGITQFSYVWEDMCMVWMHENRWSEVFYADTQRYSNTRVAGHDLFIDKNFDSPFEVELGGHKRYMRPDIVSVTDQSVSALLDVSRISSYKVRVKAQKRSEKSKNLLKKMKRKTNKVTHDTQNQTWSYDFYGMKVSRARSIIEDIGGSGGQMYRVVDFKCVPSQFYGKGKLKKKARLDERKQLTYEHALQLSGHHNTKSQLCLPNYYPEPVRSIGNAVEENRLNDDLTESEMEVLKVDFGKVLDTYLDYDHPE